MTEARRWEPELVREEHVDGLKLTKGGSGVTTELLGEECSRTPMPARRQSGWHLTTRQEESIGPGLTWGARPASV